MDYTGRLQPKGAPFSGWRDINSRDFTSRSLRKDSEKGLSKYHEQTQRKKDKSVSPVGL